VARFRNTYCLAQEACQILEISRSTLARWDGAGKIQAIYSRKQHAHAGASVFLRAEIESLRVQDKAA
jgi:predicted site-specific integrase-resolvase